MTKKKRLMLELIRDLAEELTGFELVDGYGDKKVVTLIEIADRLCSENGIDSDNSIAYR